MIVGFITIKRSSWNQTVSAPKPTTRIPDIHSIGDILPSFHFDTAIAMKIATMKASVPLIAPVVAAKAPVQIGRASGRERVCQYGYISVVAVSLTKKKQN